MQYLVFRAASAFDGEDDIFAASPIDDDDGRPTSSVSLCAVSRLSDTSNDEDDGAVIAVIIRGVDVGDEKCDRLCEPVVI